MRITLPVLKTILFDFRRSPLATARMIGRGLVQRLWLPPWVAGLRKIARQAPLILQIETINSCNSACIFCAYPGMKRQKGVMGMALFEQIVSEYAALGGGPLTLTPVVGEVLLDPHLLERLRLLKSCRRINQLSMTTNGIALERYTDAEVEELLASFACIQVSIGGLDEDTYRTLYGVNRFAAVQRGVARLLALRQAVARPAQINLAFRTNDWQFEIRFKRQLDDFRAQGAFVSHIWTYANYSGQVKSNEKLRLRVNDGLTPKQTACIYPSVHMAICWDGRITACGCADYEGRALSLGRVGENSLGEVWAGKKRTAILDAFGQGKIPAICRNCSAYQADAAIYARPWWRQFEAHQPLNLQFFKEFWGG